MTLTSEEGMMRAAGRATHRWAVVKRAFASAAPLAVAVLLGAAGLLLAQPRVLVAQQPPKPSPPPASPQPAPTPVPKPAPPKPAPATPVPQPGPPKPDLPPPTSGPAPTLVPTQPNPAAAAAKVANEFGLRDGTILFNTPTEMIQGKDETLRAIITTREITQDLVTKLRETGRVQTESILVGTTMVATLTGEAFEITLLGGPPERAMLERAENVWQWTVKPQSMGQHKLHLSAYAVVRTGERDVPTQVKVLERELTVHVDPAFLAGNFVSQNWQWLVTTMVLPLATGVWGWFWGRRSRPSRRSSGR